MVGRLASMRGVLGIIIYVRVISSDVLLGNISLPKSSLLAEKLIVMPRIAYSETAPV